jgi:hypothetical protein
MPKKTYTWRVLLIRAKAESVGTVQAPDEKAAIQKAIKDFHITVSRATEASCCPS